MGESLLGIGVAKVWLFLAALSGAIAGALAQRGLNFAGKLANFFIGFTATVFCSEFILVRMGMKVDFSSSAIIYVVAYSSNYILPSIARRISDKFKDPLEITKKDAL